ncbi:MAG: serine/threonine-protein kinase [bacterium]
MTPPDTEPGGDELPRLFADALELPPEARDEFLDRACAGNVVLRRELDSLLRAHPVAAQLFERFAPRRDVSGPAPAAGARIGPYRLLREIASGGMGAVYLAERTDDAYSKQVAVKLIRPGLGGGEITRRFVAERQVLADLEHPGIARLLDGGSTPDGRPYLVMEYVDGVPVDRFVVERGLDVRGRLELFLEICEAVDYAHRNLVIHRDLKPSNILVDADGHPRLLDFGIAKVLAGSASGERDDLTRGTALPLTPRYASPEQFAGGRMTTATDVYGLGVVLYQMLTATFPFDFEDRAAHEIADLVLHAEPVRPSRRVSRDAARRLTGDLDTILLQALAKEPERRYRTVQDFAADVRRHLNGFPVQARPDTVGYRVSRFARRNRSLVSAVAATFVVLAVALAVTTRAYRDATASRQEAEVQAYVASLAAAEASLGANKTGEAAEHLEAAPERLRGWEWRHLRSRLDRSRGSFRAHGRGITRIDFAADGRFLTASVDSTIAVWSGPGDLVARHGPFASGVESAAFLAGDPRVVVGLNDGAVFLLDPADGTRATLRDAGERWALVDASPDGRRVAAGFLNGLVRVWDVATGELVKEWRAHDGPVIVAWAPDGSALATGGADGTVHVRDARDLALRLDLSLHERRVYSLAWSPDASRLATGSIDRTARVVDARTGATRCSFREHRGTVASVAFSPDGSRVVSAGADDRVLAWNAETGGDVSDLRGHRADVSALATSPDGTWWISGDWSGEMRAWDWTAEDVKTIRYAAVQSVVPVLRQAAVRDSSVACASSAASLLVWDPTNGTRAVPAPAWPARRIAFVPGSGALVLGTDDGRLLLRSGENDGEWTVHDVPGGPLLALAVGEGVAFTGSEDGIVRRWALPGMAEAGEFASDEGARTPVLDLDLSPDGATLAVAGQDGAVRLWSVGSVRIERTIEVGSRAVTDVAFDAVGRRLATACADGSVRVWSVDSADVLALRPGGRSALTSLAWSPDGTRLAAGGTDTVVHVLSVPLGREVAALHGHVGRITSLVFARGGAWLLSTSSDATVRIWDAPLTP